MLNMCILDNFSQNILNQFLKIYEKYKDALFDTEISLDKLYSKSINHLDLSKISKEFPLPFSRVGIFYMKPLGLVVLQIAVSVGIDKSYTFAFNNEDISLLTPTNTLSHYKSNTVDQTNIGSNYFFTWDSAVFNAYPIKKPIIQNVSQPHSGANYGNSDRTFFSCSFEESYDVVKSNLSKWI